MGGCVFEFALCALPLRTSCLLCTSYAVRLQCHCNGLPFCSPAHSLAFLCLLLRRCGVCSLYANDIGDGGAAAIAGALKSSSTLLHLESVQR